MAMLNNQRVPRKEWMVFEYPLVNCHIAMERSTIFHGKIHYFYGHVQ